MGTTNNRTMMVHLWIAVILNLLVMGTSRRGATSSSIQTVKRSVGPVADCEGPTVDLGTELKNCYAKCEGYDEPKTGVSISMYQLTASGPPVTRCTRWRLTQEFTKTWTFSTVKQPMVRTQLTPTVDECKSLYMAKCSSGTCDLRAPSELPEEYHYASDTMATAEVIELQSAQGMLFLEEGSEWISPMGSDAKFSSSDGHGSYKDSIFLWNPQSSVDKCPYKEVGVYGCDQFDEDNEMFYACSGGGITVTPKTPTKYLHKDLCPGIMISDEGFLYGIHKDSPKDSKTGHLAINVNPDTAETADATYLRHKVQQVAVKLSSDICYTQCEVLSLETRNANKTSHLIRIGHEHYLTNGNGTATYCKPIHGCRLTTPATFCGGPPKVGVICNGFTRLWNPLSPFLTADHICTKPQEVERLTFNLGTSLYEVDTNLEINIPLTAIHGVHQSEFLRYHNGRLLLTVEDLSQLKEGWIKAQSHMTETTGNVDVTRKISAPHISIGSWIVSGFSWFGSLVHSTEAIIGLMFVLVIVYLTVVVTGHIMNAYRGTGRKRSGYSATPSSENIELTGKKANHEWI
ncbi:MAG: G protein [Coriander cytorhabdovirus 1]|nr:MAG: G protein [Coriander cytorhabdovirus 1]